MKISTYDNRTCVTFNVIEKGGKQIEFLNKIHKITSRHNAQQMLFDNVSPWKYDKKGNLIGEQFGDTGGTVTFHSHSCNHMDAANELIDFLKTI